EPDLRLERLLVDGSNHLERDVRTVEQARVERRGASIPDGEVAAAERVRVDVDPDPAVEDTGERVAGIIDLQVVAVERRGEVKDTGHLQGGREVRVADHDVALASTGVLRD